MRENSVVFPAPLSPSSAVKEPAGTVRLTPSSARRAPKAWLTPSTLSAASSELSLGCKGGLRSGRASLERFQENRLAWEWAPQPGEPVFRFENATKQRLIE